MLFHPNDTAHRHWETKAFQWKPMLMSSDTINMRAYYSNTLTMWYESTLCMPSSMNQCTSWLRMNIDTYPTNTSTSARINGMERVCIYMRMPSLFIWLAEHPLNDGWQRMQWNGMNTKQVPKRNKREEKKYGNRVHRMSALAMVLYKPSYVYISI